MSDKRTDQVVTNYLPPPLEWPKLKWKFEWWWAFISYVLAFIVFFFPQLPIIFKLIIGVLLLLAPFLAPILIWVWRKTKVAAKRVKFYPSLNTRAQQSVTDNLQLRRSYFDLIMHYTDERRFEIITAGHINSKLIIAVRKRITPKVSRGDLFDVIHKEDGLLMGNFQVTEIRSQEIYATGISNIDPVWLGHVRQMGEVKLIPNLVAVYLKQEK